VHKFDPQNAHRLERAERYERIPPADTLRRVGLTGGMTFVDIGAGTGFFARAAGEITGETGRVFATDIVPGMLDHIRAQGIPPHVVPVLSEEYTVPLSDGIADMTFMAFVVHETPDILRFVGEAARLTRPGGRIVIVEWIRQVEDQGPPETERLAQADLVRTLAAQYAVIEQGALNPSNYYIVLRSGKE
jgi:ubiquinone/menaquinone biosynthesis C-methylase UbiE